MWREVPAARAALSKCRDIIIVLSVPSANQSGFRHPGSSGRCPEGFPAVLRELGISSVGRGEPPKVLELRGDPSRLGSGWIVCKSDSGPSEMERRLLREVAFLSPTVKIAVSGCCWQPGEEAWTGRETGDQVGP